MKKVLLALTALAAFTGSAVAADLGARPYTKAPIAAAPAVSWTGCWVSGGGGYGISRTDRYSRDAVTGATNVLGATSGSDGWLATAGVGCDYQFSGRWVVGAFADGTWSDIKGDHAWRVFGPGEAFVGESKMDWSWAVGGRVGYLVNPSFLTYVNAGYTQARFAGVNFINQSNGVPLDAQIGAQTYSGWFVGSGFEYNLGFLPGLFWKTEYRFAQYDRETLAVLNGAGGQLDSISSEKTIQTIRSELVWRFNWSGGRY